MRVYNMKKVFKYELKPTDFSEIELLEWHIYEIKTKKIK